MTEVISGDVTIAVPDTARTDVTDDGGVIRYRTDAGTHVTIPLPEPVTDRLVRDAQLLKPDIYGSPNSVHVAEAARLRERVRELEAELGRANRLIPSADLMAIDARKAV